MLNYQANECRLFIITNRTSFELYLKKKYLIMVLYLKEF